MDIGEILTFFSQPKPLKTRTKKFCVSLVSLVSTVSFSCEIIRSGPFVFGRGSLLDFDLRLSRGRTRRAGRFRSTPLRGWGAMGARWSPCGPQHSGGPWADAHGYSSSTASRWAEVWTFADGACLGVLVATATSCRFDLIRRACSRPRSHSKVRRSTASMLA